MNIYCYQSHPNLTICLLILITPKRNYELGAFFLRQSNNLKLRLKCLITFFTIDLLKFFRLFRISYKVKRNSFSFGQRYYEERRRKQYRRSGGSCTGCYRKCNERKGGCSYGARVAPASRYSQCSYFVSFYSVSYGFFSTIH